MAKKKDRFELFEEKYTHIQIDFPCLVLLRNGNLELFHENGVREFLFSSTKAGSAGYTKSKWTGEIETYIFFIRRLLYNGKGGPGNSIGTQEDWDKKQIEVDQMLAELDKCQIGLTFSGLQENENEGYAKEDVVDTETGEITKEVPPVNYEDLSPIITGGYEEDPF